MPSSHRSARQWFTDHRRRRHRSDTTAPPSGPDKIPQLSTPQPEAADNPREFSTRAAPTDTRSTTVETEPTGSVEVAGVVDQTRQEALGQQATQEQQSPPPAFQETHDESPIWTQSLHCFATQHPECYKLIEHIIENVAHESVFKWGTWLNSPSQESRHKLFRQWKSYLPSLRTTKSLAASLANLDHNKIAPLIVAGVFVVLELCLDSFDPAVRDSAISAMLNAKELVSKWCESEKDLQSLKTKFSESNINFETIVGVEKDLEELYIKCLELIYTVYESGKNRLGRAVAALPQTPAQWKHLQDDLNNKDKDCSDRKRKVELVVKRREDNIKILDFIRIRGEDPEPSHQSILERTGVDISESTAGDWFVKTPEFTSWIGSLSNGETTKRLFWLKGSMGTGKTTLMCRAMSHFEKQPIPGVRLVPYYCYASGTSKESKAPKHETIVRALCRRLAWNSDGNVAEHAREVYDMKTMDAEESLSVKKTWGPLLEKLVDSSKSKIIFMIDALDECMNAGQYRGFLRFLGGLSKKPEGPYCLISSRPHVPVGTYFNSSLQFEAIHADADSDMRKFITSEIDSKNNATWEKSLFFEDIELRQRLEDALYKSARGMFRWVEIWLGIFFPKNQKPIERRPYAVGLLDELEQPKSLDRMDKSHDDCGDESADSWKNELGKAYSRLWIINGDEQYEKFQRSAFRIVIGALESLTPRQLLEAVCLDQIIPGKDTPLSLNQLEGLYHNFLKVNERGYLDFEHLSAKVFVSEMKKETGEETEEEMKKERKNLRFPKEECQHKLTDIVIKAIKEPSHLIWRDFEIGLSTWPGLAIAKLKEKSRLKRKEPLFWSRHLRRAPLKSANESRIRNAVDTAHFVKYIFHNWISHCNSRWEESQSVCHMIDLFNGQSRLEYLVLLTAYMDGDTGPLTPSFTAPALRASNALVQSEQGLSLNLFLLLVALGFSPFTQHTAGRLVLQEGVRNDILLPNIYKQTSLHIACAYGNNTMVTDLLEFQRAEQGSCMTLLMAKDGRGRIPMQYTCTEDIFKTLIEYEMPTWCVDENTSISQLDSEDSSEMTPIIQLVGTCSDDYLAQLFNKYSLGPNNSQNAILWEAVEYGKEKAVKFLVKNGANLDDYSVVRGPALVIAASYNNVRMLELLLDEGASIDGRDGDDGCALDYAICNGHVEAAEYLVSQGARLDFCGTHLNTPLHGAARSGIVKLARIIRRSGRTNDINAEGSLGTPLTVAICSWAVHRIEMVQFLLNEGADPNVQGGEYDNPLGAAIFRGNVEIAKLLLEKGAKIDTVGNNYGTALIAAAQTNNKYMIELLLEKGAEINAEGGEYGTALGAAVYNVRTAVPERGVEIVELLLDAMADPNAQGGKYDNPLGTAAYKGDVEIAKFLLEKGAEINTVGNNYGTALIAAAYNSHEAMIECLLEKGAEINAKGGKYGTALIAAAVDGKPEIVEMLIDAGAHVNAQGGDHGTALGAAAYYWQREMIAILLDHQADINAKGGKYGSPLGAAIHCEQSHQAPYTIKLLVSHGADIELLNEEDRAVALRYKSSEEIMLE
ncbi:ankyrin repeat-containing domain protein [Nemania abortiva]|nr:ankyrin repeat-containing domain protein [Nemania abortiva]